MDFSAPRLQRAPRGQVRHKRALEAVEQAIAQWERTDPAEVFRWKAAIKVQQELLGPTGGWSKTKELLAGAYWPSYLKFQVARNLVKQGWPHDEAQRWDLSPDGRDDSDLFKHAVRYLLPEAQVTRKEQRQLYHRGWTA